MLLILYIFAVIGCEMIKDSDFKEKDVDFKDLVEEKFPDLLTIMLTLVAFVTCDSISAVYEPMIKVDWKLIFYFIPFILVVSIALMNLVTAVIVESAIQQGAVDREDKQNQLAQEFPHFAALFEEFMEKISKEKGEGQENR